MNWRPDPNQIDIYTETRKKKIFVGRLTYDNNTSIYTFNYDRKYLLSKSAIPLGPELPLKKIKHVSKKGELFPSLDDRIPSRQNAAYEDYCLSQGISPKEKNKIILLATIGRRGPSTFVFEAVLEDSVSSESIKRFRKTLGLSLREAAAAFDFPLLTLNRIETGKSQDKNTKRLLQIYIEFPEVGLWRVKLSQGKLHQETTKKLVHYFESRIQEKLTQGRLGDL